MNCFKEGDIIKITISPNITGKVEELKRLVKEIEEIEAWRNFNVLENGDVHTKEYSKKHNRQQECTQRINEIIKEL